MSITWNEKEKSLLETIRATMSTQEIEKVFKILEYNRSFNAIQKMSKKLGIQFKDFGMPAMFNLEIQQIAAIETVLENRLINSVNCPPILSSKDKSQVTTERRKSLIELAENLNEIRESIPRYGSISFKKGESTEKDSLVLALSDWHVCQRVIDTETRQVKYDMNIAIKRIETTAELLLSKIGDISQYDECILLMMGDFMSGENIFPGHNISLHQHAVEQTTATVRATWKMIKELKEVFPIVRIITTKGNHGSSSKDSPEAN